MTRDDLNLWKRITDTVRRLGDRSRPDPHPAAPLHVKPPHPRSHPPHAKTLDLHGLTLEQAHRAVKVFVRDAKGGGTRGVFVITGRSGQIREEFLDWIEHMPEVERSQMLPNRGSFRLLIAK